MIPENGPSEDKYSKVIGDGVSRFESQEAETFPEANPQVSDRDPGRPTKSGLYGIDVNRTRQRRLLACMEHEMRAQVARKRQYNHVCHTRRYARKGRMQTNTIRMYQIVRFMQQSRTARCGTCSPPSGRCGTCSPPTVGVALVPPPRPGG